MCVSSPSKDAALVCAQISGGYMCVWSPSKDAALVFAQISGGVICVFGPHLRTQHWSVHRYLGRRSIGVILGIILVFLRHLGRGWPPRGGAIFAEDAPTREKIPPPPVEDPGYNIDPPTSGGHRGVVVGVFDCGPTGRCFESALGRTTLTFPQWSMTA